MNAIPTTSKEALYIDSRTEEEKANEPEASLSVSASSPETFVYDSSKPVDTNIKQPSQTKYSNVAKNLRNFSGYQLLQRLFQTASMSEGRKSMLGAQRNAKRRKRDSRAAMIKESRRRNRGL